MKRRSFTRSQIARYWIEWEIEHKTVPPWSSHGWDYGEPACMAGGHWSPKWDTGRTPGSRWNSTSLQKCHVVPLFKGGSDEVSNIVLMCEACHAHQPDSRDPEVTYAYMRSRTLFDCQGIGGILTMGLMDLAAGSDIDTVTERAKDRALDAWGVS